MFNLQEIARVTKGTILRGSPDRRISSVHFDSRKLSKDSLFIALTGGRRDGHEFLQQAQASGARAALISKHGLEKELDGLDLILVQDTQAAFQALARWYRQKLTLPIIAITGSNGKTTTKDLLAHLLSQKYNVFSTYKNLNNELGLPLSILQIKPEHELAVLELGMNHAGEIDLLAGIAQPTISIITNVGDAHLGYFGSKEKIAEAKGELLAHSDPKQYILLNGDDPYVNQLVDIYPGRTYFFGLNPSNDIYASNLEAVEHGTRFYLHLNQQRISCYLPMFGQFNVVNALAGAFVAAQSGFSLAEIADGLRTATISEMRFQISSGPNESLIINDAYNASPTSMKAAIDTFANIYPERKKVLVLGDILELGEQEKELHQQIGHFLKNRDFILFTIGDRAKYIFQEAETIGQHCLSYQQVAEELQAYLTREFAILFKASRGMALEKIIQLIKA